MREIDVFWVGNDGAVRSTWWAQGSNNNWNPPFSVTPPNDAQSGSTLASTARKPEDVDVFWIGNDGAIRSTWWALGFNNNWNPPFSISPPGEAR